MLVGAMNHPRRDPVDEITQFADLGLDFVNLSLEPPGAAPWSVDVAAVRAALERTGLGVVGHTAFYLPFASNFPTVAEAALQALMTCLQVFRDVGARWMNVHPDRYTPFEPRSVFIERDVAALRRLLEQGRALGVGVMIENLPGDFNTAAQLGELLDPLPELGLHLDIGHANLESPVNATAELVSTYRDRIRHVHLHDNKGGAADLHLPLGAGTLDFVGALGALKSSGYDGTITLEVFSPDHHFLSYSAKVLRETWAGL